MTKLSKTDLTNLETLKSGGFDYKGQGSAMKKLIDMGLVIRTTVKHPKGHNAYFYKTA